jgi:tRNA A58 N-methylase Trm61
MMGAWAREHVATLAAWAGMTVTLAVTVGAQWSLASAEVERHHEAIAAIEAHDAEQDDKITLIESDVRSVTEAQGRLEGLVTRQEATVREMQTLTAELRAHVRVMRGTERAR